ncbi:MAG: hypothetical protein KatS3mg034_1290 [Vicingaceae bacterium]|nr:MAG: hypothetical protein KatS3mg034_1290 [Vicingaceae bacterium]
MAEQLWQRIDNEPKDRTYQRVIQYLDALLTGENDLIAKMANISAVIKEAFQWHWVGYYRVVGKELVLGPFQGPVACMRIGFGKGVCGKCWENQQTIIVPDVNQFPGHIACSPFSKSEIVVPLIIKGRFEGLLDIDSERYDSFDTIDQIYLEKIHQLYFNAS